MFWYKVGEKDGTREKVAIKLEPLELPHRQLEKESRVYERMKDRNGFPKLYWYGKEKKYNAMVLELLGPSLEDLFNICNRRFTLKTILCLGYHMLQRIEMLHQVKYLHRDIKPDNFLIGHGDQTGHVYLIDFGLAKRYFNGIMHIPYMEGRPLTGTARYASISSHLGVQLDRRDDIESLAYVLIYFAVGRLPWQGIEAQNRKQRYAKICELKLSTSVKKLCQGLPEVFAQLLVYSRGLRYSEQPDYAMLSRWIETALGAVNVYRFTYDWEPRLKNDETLTNEMPNLSNEISEAPSALIPSLSQMQLQQPHQHPPQHPPHQKQQQHQLSRQSQSNPLQPQPPQQPVQVAAQIQSTQQATFVSPQSLTHYHAHHQHPHPHHQILSHPSQQSAASLVPISNVPPLQPLQPLQTQLIHYQFQQMQQAQQHQNQLEQAHHLQRFQHQQQQLHNLAMVSLQPMQQQLQHLQQAALIGGLYYAPADCLPMASRPEVLAPLNGYPPDASAMATSFLPAQILQLPLPQSLPLGMVGPNDSNAAAVANHGSLLADRQLP